MSLLRFRLGVLAAFAVSALLFVWWRVVAGDRALERRWEAVAVAAATAVRQAMAAGEPFEAAAHRIGDARGFAVRVLCPLPASGGCPASAAPLDAALLDALRRDEAPRPVAGGVVAPLKDADDWDVVGAVQITPTGAAGQPSMARPAVVLPLAALVLAAGWLLRWGARIPERRRRETLTAWSFLGPPFLHLVVFAFVPLGFTLYLAFHQWDLVAAAKPFVGLANFRELARDRLFWTTLRNTALFVLYVPVTMAGALGLAVLLNRRKGGERLLRAVVFLPFVTSTVAIGIVWQWMFNADFGLVNYALGFLGVPPLDWLGSPRTALLSIVVVTIWTQVGYQMVVFLAGLQGVPQSYYDAALVDGASPWQRFRHVTLPLLRPVILFVLVTGIISGFQVFTLVYLMTEGGPLHSTDVLVYRIYQTAWEFLRFGYASAMAVVLFGVLLVVTVVQFRLLGKRIEYV